MNKEDTKKAIEIMQAFLDGKTIEARLRLGTEKRPFTECSGPAWNFMTFEYRIKVSIPDSIDWSQVNDNYVSMFRFKSGAAVLCTSVPHLSKDNSKYWKNIGSCANPLAFKSYKQGNLPWDESLVIRPKTKPYVVETVLGYD